MSEREQDGRQAIDRALALFEAIVLDSGGTPASEIAAALGIAASTARRYLASFAKRGLIMRIARGRYTGSDRLRMLAAKANPHARLIEIARPVLRRLARQFHCTAHLGLFENDMVTYLVKEGGHGVFTREHNQLEAYCTGIGKALLAQLPAPDLEAYLDGLFVALTEKTITDPNELRRILQQVRSDGHAIDDREMADDLFCIAVPLLLHRQELFAISVSGSPHQFVGDRIANVSGVLQSRADQIANSFLHCGARASVAP